MADIFDQIAPEQQKPQSKGDIFDQLSSDDYFNNQGRAADDNPEMAQAKADVNGGWIPKGFANAAKYEFINPAVQALNSGTSVVNGVNKFMQPVGHNMVIPQIQGPDMTNADRPEKWMGDIAGGVTQGGMATLASGGNPAGFIPAMAAISGLGAYDKGQPVVPAAIQGAESAVIPSVAGRIGGGIANAALNKIAPEASQAIKGFVPRFGTAVSMGAAGAATGGVEGAATGATFGALSPMGGTKEITQDQFENQELPKAGDAYKQILNPGKGYVNKIEVKQGADVDQAAQELARQGVILKRGADGKLDNSDGMTQLNSVLDQHSQALNQLLASDKSSQFDLEAIRNQAKNSDSLQNQFKNDVDYNKAKGVINDEIDAAIQNHGRYINGEQLNNMKSGWWKVGYDQNNLVRQPVARQLGNISKNAIEEAYPNGNVTSLNNQMGRVLSAKDLLQNTNGNVIQGGKIGKYVAKGIGAIAGEHTIPIVGPIIGSEAGEKLSNWSNDPERITTGIQNRLKNFKIINPQAQGEYIPPTGKAQAQQQPIDVQAEGPSQIGFNPRLGIRQYNYGPDNLRSGGFQPNPTGQAVSKNAIPIPPTSRKDTARFQRPQGPILNFNQFGKMVRNRRKPT